MSDQRAIAIIPVRYASTRFPGKPLARETGKFLFQHVYEQTSLASSVARVCVATDDQRIMEAAHQIGAKAILTRADHPNGTSRIAEVVASLPVTECDVIVNVQGDEPEIDPSHIDAAVHALGTDDDVATLASPFSPDESADDPNIVKVVTNLDHRALYFSRSRVPHSDRSEALCLKHIGLYVYRRAFLLEYVNWPATPLESAERLEQLRVLEHGRSIAVAVVDDVHSHGIDTPEQYQAFVKRWRTSKAS